MRRLHISQVLIQQWNKTQWRVVGSDT